MSVGRSSTTGPRPLPVTTAVSVVWVVLSNVYAWPGGLGRFNALAPAPVGMEMPPIGMSRPARIKSLIR